MLWQYLLLWIILYTLVAISLSKYIEFKDRTNITGPILSIRSNLGLKFFRKTAKKIERFWSVWGILGVISSILTAILGFILITSSVLTILLTEPAEVGIQGPTDMLVIPGVNRFLPLDAAPEIIIGLLIAMIVHEGGHAIYCVLGDIKIKSTGIIFGALIPIGAFVEPDEEEQFEANTLDQLKMYSAGIMNNYAIFIICIVLLFIMVPLLVNPVSGIAVGTVFPDSPADNAGIESGDVIVGINEVEVNDTEISDELISNNKGINTVETRDGDRFNIQSGAYVIRASEPSGVEVGSTITKYNGKDVNYSGELSDLLSNESSEKVTLEYLNGNSTQINVGAYVTAKEKTGLAESLNLDVGNSTIVSYIGGDKVNNNESLSSVITDNIGNKVEIRYLKNDEFVSTNYTIDDNENLNSVIALNDTSGISTSNLGIDIYPKDNYYGSFAFGDSIVDTAQNTFKVLYLPVSSIVPGISFGFPGFTTFVQNFYTTPFGGYVTFIIFFIMNVLFWTSWINFNLALFNCLPTFALDGGFILKASVESIPIDISSWAEIWIIRIIKLFVLIPIILLLFAPLVI